MAIKIPTFINRWSPPILWALLIFTASSLSTIPGAKIIWWDFIIKKSGHMFLFGTFFFLSQRATNWQQDTKKYLLPLLITIIYAALDEYHQSFVQGRTALPSDIGYDTLGASLVYLRLKGFI